MVLTRLKCTNHVIKYDCGLFLYQCELSIPCPEALRALDMIVSILNMSLTISE